MFADRVNNQEIFQQIVFITLDSEPQGAKRTRREKCEKKNLSFLSFLVCASLSSAIYCSIFVFWCWRLSPLIHRKKLYRHSPCLYSSANCLVYISNSESAETRWMEKLWKRRRKLNKGMVKFCQAIITQFPAQTHATSQWILLISTRSECRPWAH